MFQQIDSYLAYLFGKPLRLLTRLTGQSNYFFARVGFLAAIPGIFLEAWRQPLSAPIYALALIIAGIHWRGARELENHNLSNEALPVIYNFILNAGIYSRIGYSAGTILIPVNFDQYLDIHQNVFTLLWPLYMTAAMYWTIDYQPRQKSAIRKAAEKILSYRPSFQPTLAPNAG